jgi:two-component system CitB family sensor kinase
VTRPRWLAQVWAQVLLVQLAIAAVVSGLAAVLFLAPLGDQLNREAMNRALAIAQSTAADPEIALGVADGDLSPGNPVQRAAERVRRATGAEYVVVMDTRGVRLSHPQPDRIGERVSTDPSQALAGREVTAIENGTLGRTARGKVPLRDAGDRIVGAVSVGIPYVGVRQRLLSALPELLAYAAAALAVGAVAALEASRRLHRSTRGIETAEIASLLAERDAMLHSIREGVVALDARGRIRLVNDEAQRLLALPGDAAGRPVEEVLPPGRLADVLTGRARGADLLTVAGDRVLVANRMATEDGGAVATLRDRTELEQLGRELDSTRGLTEALRAQDHEHANRLHTLMGLLELGLHDEAVEFITDVAGAHRSTAARVGAQVRDPLVAALLVGKAAVADERGVDLRLCEDALLPEAVVDSRDLVTVLGNLVDNALDAAAGGRDPFVEVDVRAEGRTVVLRVADSGPGVPPEAREKVFTDGWSTKRPAGHRRRGLGLVLVRRLAERYGGTATVGARPGGGAVFTVVLPEAVTARAEQT